jgi:aminoglycoside phosphotransferase
MPSSTILRAASPDWRPLGILSSGERHVLILAIDDRTGASLIVKTLQPGLRGHAAARAALEAEGRTASRMRHETLVRFVGAHADADGCPCLVLGRAPGTTLAELVDLVGALPPERAAHVAAELLRGLHHMHRRGYGHGGVRARNVVVARSTTSPDRVVLVDYRRSRRAHDAAALERAIARDLFDVARLLMCLVTGARGAASSSRDVSGLPPGLGRVVARALSPAAGGGFASAREMRTALEPWASRFVAMFDDQRPCRWINL